MSLSVILHARSVRPHNLFVNCMRDHFARTYYDNSFVCEFVCELHARAFRPHLVFAHWQQPCRTSTKSTFTVMWTVLKRLLQQSPSRKCRCCRTRGGTGGGGRAATAPNGWGAGDTSRRAAPASETSVSSSQSPAPDTVAKAAGCVSSNKLFYL